MENKISENEIKELEDEIDSAVDRLFRDKTAEPETHRAKEPPPPASSYDPAAVASSPSEPKPVERLETRLLQLEWDVTGENLLKTEEEIEILRKELKDNPRVLPVLGFMGKVLNRMIQNSDSIEPSSVKFLLDSKDTLNLLAKEGEGEIKVYQQLASQGLEARFSLLEAGAGAQPAIPSAPSEPKPEAGTGVERPDKTEETLQRIRAISERTEGVLSRMEETLLRIGGEVQKWRKGALPAEKPSFSVTIIKANGKLFGVENDKIYKVFRVPEVFYEKYSKAEKIRLREVEVRMIDLRKVLSVTEENRRGEERILVTMDNGEYKGFRVEQVLKKLSTPLLQKGGLYAEFCSGVVQWKHGDFPAEIPVLDVKKF